MSNISTYSGVLDFPIAKKLFESLQKPGKGGRWSDWSGVGGVGMNNKIEKITTANISSIILPDHCTSFSVTCWDYTCFSENNMPDEFFLGGDDWLPPDFGDCSEIRFYLVPKGFKQAVMLSFSKRTGMNWFGKNYDKCLEIELSQGNRLDLISQNEVFEHGGEEVDLMKLWKSILLPDEQDASFLEASHFERSHRFFYNPKTFPKLNRTVRQVIQGLLSESPIERFYMWGKANVGGQAWFEGESFNVTEPARELLSRIACLNAYPSYKITYSYLGYRSWKDREKFRKKLKEPGHEQLGILTLENGAVAQVSLGIEKEGYVFYLNFNNDDDLIKFYHSKLFKKIKWHSGAE